MADADIRVKGLAELGAFLMKMPPKLARNVVRGALRQGAKPVAKDAKTRIRSRTGELVRGISTSASVRDLVVKGRVTSRASKNSKRPENVPIWVEFGTRPHLISVADEEKPINARLSARRGRVVRASMTTVNRIALKIGNRFVGPTVKHPGAERRPYLRPALDTKARAAIVAAGEYMKQRLATKYGLDTADVEIRGDA